MYAVVGETLGADEFESKFFKGKVAEYNCYLKSERQCIVKRDLSGGVPRQ